MKNLIYIGNKSGITKNANVSSIDILAPLFTQIGFKVITASKKSNIILRLLDMLWVCIKNRKQTDYVLIDTYSTLNFFYAYFVSQLCRILRLKYIPIMRGGDLPSRLKKSPYLSKRIFKNAHINIAPSLFTQLKFEALGYNNILCIPNSIELKNYLYKARTFESIKLLWVRSFSKIYNPLLAIDVLKRLKDDNLKAELCMVGPDSDGSLKTAKAYANESGVDVKFTGKLSKKEWIELSAYYNVFINTTNIDNMPVSVIEAMALGLPIISTNVGGMPYLINHKKTGILVTPKSIDAFVDSINKITRTTEMTFEMTQNARRQVEKLDWEVIKKQWIKVLK